MTTKEEKRSSIIIRFNDVRAMMDLLDLLHHTIRTKTQFKEIWKDIHCMQIKIPETKRWRTASPSTRSRDPESHSTTNESFYNNKSTFETSSDNATESTN